MKHRASRTPPSGRELWPDVAKGACIILIVLWHVVSKHFWYLDGYTQIPPNDFWRWFVEVLQPVRMPLFFAIAGMFAATALARPLGVLVRTRIAKFAYLYVVWVLIHTAVMSFTPQVRTARAQDLWQLIEFLTISPTSLWFLYALAVYFSVARLVRRVPRTAVLAIALLLTSATGAGLILEPTNQAQVVQNFSYFLIGLYGRDQLMHLARVANCRLLLTCLTLFAAGVTLMVGLDAETWFGVRPAVSVIGIALGVTAAAVTARTARRTSAVLAYLGQRTLPIYVLHLALFAVLEQLAIYADLVPSHSSYRVVGPIVVTCVLIIGCLGTERLLRGLGAGFLFEPPFSRRPRMRTAT